MTDAPNYCLQYDLSKARKNDSQKVPASHQSAALEKLYRWYESRPKTHKGAILVLPTGGGKTFTAVRFLCKTALSDGYKVLWLAHTHHLLEQAFKSLEEDLGEIAEPRSHLKVRVVSGTKDHYPVYEIKPDDDVVIATLQTISKAHKERHRALEAFLKSAGKKLFVIFDEAHHAPAPSYRKLIQSLREQIPDMYILGLTATPTYTDKGREGWLAELFPQGIKYQVAPQKLMAEGILAEPVPEKYDTNFEPNFDEREYLKWIGTFRDIPEDVIGQLAENRGRNEYIGATYVSNRNKYGKTIIFADRWDQCEFIGQYLENRDIRAGSVYSHVIKGVSKKSADENNKKVLEDFKAGKLDVILNIRMLTEGTDVPDAESVFITRQTTSRNLMTQMVGRALRGPKFGGTEKAHLVFFTDNWQQLINWAEYEMPDGGTDGKEPKPGERLPLQYISIELVRKLAMQMDSGSNFNATPFLQLLPVGWYIVDYTAQLNGSDNLEPVKRFVMVFDHEKEGYERLVNGLNPKGLDQFEDENVQFEDVSGLVEAKKIEFFPEPQSHFGSNLNQDIFSILRHMAQNNSPPKFFPFSERENHDLDKIAQDLVNKSMTDFEKNELIKKEYGRDDRYWKMIYPSYDNFKSRYDGCVNWILNPPSPGKYTGEIGDHPPVDLTDEEKHRIKERDGYKCLCCGTTKGSPLQVDHIDPKHWGGSNDPENLQTLCGKCNSRKGTDTINFRNHEIKLKTPPESLPKFEMPEGPQAKDDDVWKEFISKTVNFFYQCGAVQEVIIHDIGYYFYNWQILLYPGNDPKWLEPYLPELLKRIRNAREPTKYGSPNKITVKSLDRKRETNDSTPFIGTFQWIKDKLSGNVETAEVPNFVGSRDSNKYHLPSCGWAERIPSEDRIYFPSTEAAKSRGYKPCMVCKPNMRRKRQ
ncbi:MAG TPA: DEAD/DEAH box helicase family protein [Methanothrix sp.]|nr:DEAD/DEAH box helicase family protein [Methanothrix sp.]HPJ83174.1 DEAD/DEAH box helicase family protein [Methanothrix sp.]